MMQGLFIEVKDSYSEEDLNVDPPYLRQDAITEFFQWASVSLSLIFDEKIRIKIVRWNVNKFD